MKCQFASFREAHGPFPVFFHSMFYEKSGQEVKTLLLSDTLLGAYLKADTRQRCTPGKRENREFDREQWRGRIAGNMVQATFQPVGFKCKTHRPYRPSFPQDQSQNPLID